MSKKIVIAQMNESNGLIQNTLKVLKYLQKINSFWSICPVNINGWQEIKMEIYVFLIQNQ